MRTAKETIDFLKKRIKRSGMLQKEVLEKAGLSVTVFAMSITRNSYLRLESLISIGEVLNISVEDILGIDKSELPEDIQKMVDMLKSLSPESRKMIAMNIENYYKVELQNKAKSSD